MIDLAITSIFFLFCLIIGPLLMAKNLQLRRWSFLFVCLCLYLLSLNNLESLTAITVFVAFPYCYLYVVRKWNAPLWPAILFQLLVLIYINKYTWILSFFGIPIPSIISLVGVSYIFFRQLDVLFQVKAQLVQTVSLIDYLNYLLSFWTILAGPIQRYGEFIKEFYEDKKPVNDEDALRCFHRVANGFLKILLIGSFCLYMQEQFYSFFSESTSPIRLLAFLGFFYCFPLYLYFNFSGYCDVVIGMARWAGFLIPENFDRPWLSRDMIDMWNRWHITLSQWLRDYVYQPLFKSLLSGPFRNHLSFSQYLSIFFTFFLVGIWHGTTMNYLIFGLLQGMGMAFSMIYRDMCKKYMGKERYKSFYNNKWVENVERFITLHFWCFTFIFFQYDISKISPHMVALFGV
jgi:D-alanyl-lipoteichoic acid acyltransferase DltB (MBOAT superfamily)